MDKGKRRAARIAAIVKEIGEVLDQKLTEETAFTGKVDFTVHCHQGGIGNVEAFSRQGIKNGHNKK